MRQFIYFVLLLICAVLLDSCGHTPQRQIDESIDLDSIEQCEYNYVPTVHDVLEQREELKYALFVDSVYLNMPEQILVQMLVSKGTTISITEIVEDYIANKDFYHNTVLKSMNIQRKYIPDSVPKSSTPDNALKNKDTIPPHDK